MNFTNGQRACVARGGCPAPVRGRATTLTVCWNAALLKAGLIACWNVVLLKVVLIAFKKTVKAVVWLDRELH